MSDLPTGWAAAPLGEVVEILDSVRVPINAKEREHRRGDVPYFGATGQVGWIDDYLFDQEIVLLGEDGAPFLDMTKPKAYLVSGKSWVNNHAHVLVGKDGLSNRFLMYQLNTVDYRKFVSGTTRLKLPQGPMRQFSLSVAPSDEQDRIVAEIEKQFTRLDAATAALKRVQANLKRYRASVLKAACEGRLVPTDAELARKGGRDYEPANELLQRILRERRARWEADALAKMRASGKPAKDNLWKQRYKEPSTPDTTRLPTLPEGWCWASLEQLTSLITSGSRGWGDSYAEAGPLFVRAQDIKTDLLELGSVAHVDLPSDSEGTRTRIFQYDLLVTITGANVTKAALVTLDIEEAYVSQHVGLVRPVLCETANYLYSWIISPSQGRRELLRLAYGAGKPGLNLENLRTLLVALPPVQEQVRLENEKERLLSTTVAVTSSIQQQIVKANRTRSGILQHAFTGQLVAQDPTDEPASVLLERIRAERSGGFTQRAVRRSRNEPAYV